MSQRYGQYPPPSRLENELGDQRSEIPPQPMLLTLRCTVNDIEPFGNLRDKSWDFLRGMLQVVINCDDYFIHREADPREQCIVLAVVAHHADPMQPLILLGQRGDLFPTPVATSVIDEDNLVGETEGFQRIRQSADERAEDSNAIVDWYTTERNGFLSHMHRQ